MKSNTEENMDARRASWRTPEGEAAWDALFESMKPLDDIGDYKDAFLAGHYASTQQNQETE